MSRNGDGPEVEEIARRIERSVAYFNGWRVEDATMKSDCRNAAESIVSYLRHRQSALLGLQRKSERGGTGGTER